jgi:CheY-like chemotaxis protein
VLGASRLLRDDAKLSADQREMVGVIQRAGMRMLEMVNLSLGLFRMETGTYEFRPQAVDLRELVTRVMVDLQSYADAHSVTLHLQGSEIRPVLVRAEELLCYSVLANVLRNAVEAAGPGRRVSIAIRRGDPVSVAVHNPGEVPAGIAARFFDKYVTQGKSGGTGLGTYSSRLMARVQQGDLQLRTGPEGTTVTLTLKPLAEAPSRALPARPAQAAPAQWAAGLPTRNMLIVDDDEYTRLVMRRFVPSPPFEVETAANGKAAMDAMARRWPDYLAIDMEMPFQGGLETVRWVRERESAQQLARCRIVMWSGNDDATAAAQARAAGADRFLAKPVSRDALVATLLELEFGEHALAAPDSVLSDLAVLEPPRPEAGTSDVVIQVDPEWKDFLNVFPEFLRTQRDTVDAMARALAAGDREEVRFLAHRIRGALLMMGVHWAARQSRAIEQRALHASAPEIERTIQGLRDYLKRVRFAS